MLHRHFLSSLLVFLLLACQGSSPTAPPSPTPFTHKSKAAPSAITPTSLPQEEPCCKVYLHPEENLYVGDQISFEIVAPSQEPFLNQAITLTLAAPAALIGSTTFQTYGFDRRPQATLLWVWDTQSLTAGDYTLQFSIPSLQKEWTQTVTLLPRTVLPPAEQMAQWQTLTTDCCEIHFITNTAAQRDIEAIAAIVEREYQLVQERIPVIPEARLGIVLIPRVIGNGGFANAEINVSYLDRNYTAADFATILHHEMVHVLDQQAQPEGRPSLFVEGIAVYLSGGHYFPESLLPRAAEVLRLNRYIPLKELANDFYDYQHEIAYLEAGALVDYLSRRWSWQRIWETYLEMTLRKGESHLQAIERALRTNLGISLEELEDDFVANLENHEANAQTSLDITTLEIYYETLRAYQRYLDPSAYYRTAWMLDAQQMRHKGIVADYFRHPSRAENLTLELLLNEAGNARRAAEFGRAARIIEAVGKVLANLEEEYPEPFSADPLTENAWEVVQVLLEAGYEPQLWMLNHEQAEVLVTQGTPILKRLTLRRQPEGWTIVSGTSAARDDLVQGTQ